MSGYPFRVELNCSSVRFSDGKVTGSAGHLRSVAQVYQPRHIISELEGPFRFTDGRISVDGQWQRLETSLRGASEGLQRASLVVSAPHLKIRGLTPEELPLSSERFEVHVRPNPARVASEGAYDAAVASRQARIPGLDQLAGGSEPADVQIDLTATQARGASGRTGIDEVERWREAGGKLEVVHFAIVKGARKLEAKGELQLDDAHRLAGRLNLAAAGLDELVANVTGIRGGLVGALLGGGTRPGETQPSLKTLPPLTLQQGRVMIGPFTVPRVQLQPLY